MKNTNFVKWHKHQELEEIAVKIHQLHGADVPIDIDYLVEIMGLEIREISRLKEDFGLYGLLAKIKGKFVIFVQRGDLKLTNYHTNLTIAEELSHCILHRDHFSDVNSLEDAYNFYIKLNSQQSEMMIEFNAKQLAYAILLPRADLRKRADETYEKNKIAISQIVKTASEDACDVVISSIASSLSDIYRVPDGAIAFRLKTKIVGFKDFLSKNLKKLCE